MKIPSLKNIIHFQTKLVIDWTLVWNFPPPVFISIITNSEYFQIVFVTVAEQLNLMGLISVIFLVDSNQEGFIFSIIEIGFYSKAALMGFYGIFVK